ncbi:MAG TPA: NAD(P)/FAD-dependent oxidoreductase [Candidatus Limnocylindria bacterium]|nr:NAD(P)/FAD-dependent oxidoreductase [Candidatus Limnocylindria bacterium]
MSRPADVEVAVVGGGPAGAALAIRLAGAGREVALFERLPRPRWRASGVYSSPLTRRRLAALGLSAAQLDRLVRPISAMVIETAGGGAACRLDYPAPLHACGIDRVRLEEALLARARDAGARVHEAAVVRQVRLSADGAGLLVSTPAGPAWWRSRLVVGADGPGSIVARAAGVGLPVGQLRRAALTGHRRDLLPPAESVPAEARMLIGSGWYLGIAPVPGGRVNLGLVLGEAELRRELGEGASLERVIERRLSEPLRSAIATDELQVHLPLLNRVRRTAGASFLLVGDAAGFVDPISGEGLHRALVSAELGARAIEAWSAGRSRALSDYDRTLRARFRSKDALSWMLQLFLFEPRLAGWALDRLSRRPRERQLFARGLADLAPASRLLDPRYLARVLAP